MSNPLLSKFDNPYNAVPFDIIKDEDFLPALKESIEIARKRILDIKNVKIPTFENVIVALDRCSAEKTIISQTFHNLHSSEVNEKLQAIAKEFAPIESAFGNEIALDLDLFAKVKEVYEQKDTLQLVGENALLLEDTFNDFKRNGALLDNDGREKIKKLDELLSKLALEYQDKNLAATNEYLKVIESKDELNGLPESIIEQASATAKDKGVEGKWAVTLEYPSYIPFMTYSTNRELKKELSEAFSKKNCLGNKNDTREILKEIVKLRIERANLLGFKTHSDFILAERMAGDPKTVLDFSEDLYQKAFSKAKEETEQLISFAKEELNIADPKSWDMAYVTQKLKMKLFNIDDEALKPYFELDKVLNGAFDVANKLYGFTFEKINTIPTYHKDVVVYDVKNKEGNHQAIFYADFFPRAGKRSGAWMTEYKGQFKEGGVDYRPHVSIVCNFTKPTETKPSLLTFNEVTTLFHEFGHALHGMMSNCNYSYYASPNVFWDFVELPSQIMENWCFEKEALQLFAKHFETGELIPLDLVENIKKSASFMEGRFTIRQLSLGYIDMMWHTLTSAENIDPMKFEEEHMAKFRLLPKDIEGTCFSTSFSHIFAGGYSSGYYSYKWAEVLDADAFALFQEKGIFNKEVAGKFAKLLSLGGSVRPMDLYKDFRGHEPTVDALLKRAGLLPA